MKRDKQAYGNAVCYKERRIPPIEPAIIVNIGFFLTKENGIIKRIKRSKDVLSKFSILLKFTV